jgi:hypothetical protein
MVVGIASALMVGIHPHDNIQNGGRPWRQHFDDESWHGSVTLFWLSRRSLCLYSVPQPDQSRSPSMPVCRLTVPNPNLRTGMLGKRDCSPMHVQITLQM